MIAAFASSACQTMAADYDRPARIVNADEVSRTALQAAVSQALGTEVLLAKSALTDSSLLTIERWPAGKLDNPVPQGRILEGPVRFQLMRSGNACVLVRQNDRSRYVLTDTECEAE